MVELKWQDPPSRIKKPRTSIYADVIQALKANPGKWALITDDWRATSAPAAFRQAKCEATTRRNDDGKRWSVWARFPLAESKGRQDAGVAKKAKVAEAITTGTALKPPPPPLPRNPAPAANDMGLQKFLADRRARGAVDIRE